MNGLSITTGKKIESTNNLGNYKDAYPNFRNTINFFQEDLESIIDDGESVIKIKTKSDHYSFVLNSIPYKNSKRLNKFINLVKDSYKISDLNDIQKSLAEAQKLSTNEENLIPNKISSDMNISQDVIDNFQKTLIDLNFQMRF